MQVGAHHRVQGLRIERRRPWSQQTLFLDVHFRLGKRPE
jgi:hypothetical protein